MRNKVFAMKDNKLGEFTQVFFEENYVHAIRGLHHIIAEGNNVISKYAEDFDMYYIGEFDSKTGLLVPLKAPEHIISGAGARAELYKKMQVQDNQSNADLGNITEKLHKAISSVNEKIGS